MLLSTFLIVPLFASESVAVADQLDTLFVTDSRATTAESTAPRSMFTSVDIERLHLKTVAEALPYIPGVQVRRGKKGEAYVRMRGFRQREVLILIDGIPLNSAYSGQIDLERIAADNIDRIFVTRGTPSVSYGPGGMAGVINIITKDGYDSLHCSAQVSGEGALRSKDGIGGKGTTVSGSGGGSVDGFRILAGGRYQRTEGFSLPGSFNPTPFQKTRDRNNSDRTNGGFYCNTTYSFSDQVHTGFRGSFSQGGYGKPPVISSTYDFPRYERTDPYRTFDGRIEVSTDIPCSQVRPLKKVAVQSVVYGSRFFSEENRYGEITLDSVTRHYNYRDNMFGAIILGGFDYGRIGHLYLSCAYSSMDHGSNGWQSSTDTVQKVALEYRAGEGYAAVEYNIALLEKVEIAAGICFTAYNRRGADNIQSSRRTYPRGWLLDNCPQAGISYYPMETIRVFGAVGKKINNPTLRELYEVKGDADPALHQPELVAEKSVNYETGVEYFFSDRMQSSLSYFYNDIDNLIENNNATSLYENIPSIASQGVECDVHFRPTNRFEATLQYTWLSMEEMNNENRQEMQYRPQHSGTFRSTIMLPAGTATTLDGQFVGKQYFYAAGKREMSPYFLLGWHIRQDLGQHTQVQAGVKNITDTYYEESWGLPQSGRYYYLGIKLTY